VLLWASLAIAGRPEDCPVIAKTFGSLEVRQMYLNSRRECALTVGPTNTLPPGSKKSYFFSSDGTFAINSSLTIPGVGD